MKIAESLKKHFIAWVWNHTPNCAEMSRLASQSLEKPLPVATRFKMRLHNIICVWCRRYRKQLSFLHGAAPGLDAHLAPSGARGLSVHAKERILRRLQG